MTDSAEDVDIKEVVTAVIEYLDENDLLVKAGESDEDIDVHEAIEQLTDLQERTVDQLERQSEAENEENPLEDSPANGATGRGFY